MQHHRRKRLLSALNEMYMTNLNRAKTYRDFLVMERGLIAVSEAMKSQEHGHADVSVQLDLFAPPSVQASGTYFDGY